MIRFECVGKSYGGSVVIDNLSVTIRQNQTTALIGPSGSGKSTLLALIIGLETPDKGAILIDTEPLTTRSALRLRRRMGYVIQDGGLFPHLNARQNIDLMAKEVGWPARRRLERVDELCALTRFPPSALDRFPIELSGGQRQRVSLMRALMLDPDILLMDEPLGALDPMIRAELQGELKSIFRDLAKTVVLVTHDLAEAAFFGDAIVVLHEGRIVQQGQFRDLVERPAEPFVTRIRSCSIKPPRRDERPGAARASEARMKLVRARLLLAAILAMVAASSLAEGASEEVRIGSKKFTESVILADLATQLATSTGAVVAHRQELGGTRLLWDALLANEIDIYPEYTGTLKSEILANEGIVDEASLDRALATRNLNMSRPLGFNNSYALGMMRQTAKRLRIENISDLARHPALRFGLSDEFLSREDGWPAIRLAYGLKAVDPRGLDHDLAYKGLVDGSIEVIDLYTTDPEISFYGVETLADDRHQFADNQAVLIYRADLERRAPKALRAMLRLEGAIDASSMMAMNGAAKIDRRPEAQVAAAFLATSLGLANVAREEGLTSRLARRTVEHLRLVLLSLGAAIVVALPLGVIAAKRPTLGHAILAVASVLQTIRRWRCWCS